MFRIALPGVVVCLASLLTGAEVTTAEEKKQRPDPFATYDTAPKQPPGKANPPLPEELRRSYQEFVAAINKAEDAKALRGFCLPHAVEITTETRPKDKTSVGNGMNLPFLKTKFSAAVVTARQDSKDCYLLRTATTAFFYVNTRTEGWMIWSYSDFPIE